MKVNFKALMLGEMDGQSKIDTINDLSDDEILSVPKSLVKSLVEACGGNIVVKSERRKGNHWNSLVEDVHVSKSNMFVDIYLQNDSTDTNLAEYYDSFFISGSSAYRGYSERLEMRFSYSKSDRADVMRSILCEYVYFTDIEKDERLLGEKYYEVYKRGKVGKIHDKYFNEWRLSRLCGGPISRYASNSDIIRLEGYYNGKKAVEHYMRNHTLELAAMKDEEIYNTLIEVWDNSYEMFKRTFDVDEYRKNCIWF